MKKISVIVLSLSLVALFAAGAMAGPWGQGRGWGYGPGAYAQLTPEQKAQLDKTRAAYLQDTLELRQKMSAMRQEYRTLLAQPNYDKAKAKALAIAMVDLRAQLDKKRIEHFADLPAGFGPGFGGGPGGGRGMRGGYGPGQGYGPGACWR